MKAFGSGYGVVLEACIGLGFFGSSLTLPFRIGRFRVKDLVLRVSGSEGKGSGFGLYFA